MSAARVVLNPAAIAAFARGSEVAAILARLGPLVAEVAKGNARGAGPGGLYLTGEGIESIDWEVGEDADGLWLRVSWGAEEFYMYFAEVGTQHQPATPFLRPALTQRYAL